MLQEKFSRLDNKNNTTRIIDYCPLDNCPNGSKKVVEKNKLKRQCISVRRIQ